MPISDAYVRIARAAFPSMIESPTARKHSINSSITNREHLDRCPIPDNVRRHRAASKDSATLKTTETPPRCTAWLRQSTWMPFLCRTKVISLVQKSRNRVQRRGTNPTGVSILRHCTAVTQLQRQYTGFPQSACEFHSTVDLWRRT